MTWRDVFGAAIVVLGAVSLCVRVATEFYKFDRIRQLEQENQRLRDKLKEKIE